MTKKTIAVDIDDVLSAQATAFIAYSNEKWGTNLTIEDFDENWEKMWKIDRATLNERIKEIDSSKLFTEHEHFEEALPVLKKLAKKYKLVITTSRRRSYQHDTLEWIEKHYSGIFSEIHHAGIYDELTDESFTKTKAELCKQIDADYLIDDQPKHCLAVADAGIPALLFGDYPWNRNLGKLPDNVSRVKNWGEVAQYFHAQS